MDITPDYDGYADVTAADFAKWLRANYRKGAEVWVGNERLQVTGGERGVAHLEDGTNVHYDGEFVRVH